MAKDSYKKRMRAGWRQGKSCKGDGEERQYAKQEIKQSLAEMDASYLEKHKGKRKPNHRARLEYEIRWYEDTLSAKWRKGSPDDWFANHMRDRLKKAKAKLKKLLAESK